MSMSDGGLALERTDLAWQRTGLSHAGAGVALLRLLPTSPVRPLLAIAMIGVGAVTSIGTRRLDPGRPHRGWLRFLATATTVATASACLLTLLA